MTLNFNLTAADQASFNIYHYKSNARYKITMSVLRILFPIALIPLVRSINIPNQNLLYIAWVLFTVVWVMGLPYFFEKLLTKNVLRMIGTGKNEFTGAFTLTVDEDSFEYNGESSRINVRLDSVERVENDDINIYIYTGSVSAYIVPLSAFADKEEVRAFKAKMLSKKNERAGE